LYLIDTNVWLERLLNQEKSKEVCLFLDSIASDRFYITDFTFHSIGVILYKLKEIESLTKFVRDIFIDGAVHYIHLEPEDTEHMVDTMYQFRLDFDDAYQYVGAEKYGLTLVSFDTDFDRTKLGRKTPDEVLRT
jgi:predicted nucleic acid-binding protein